MTDSFSYDRMLIYASRMIMVASEKLRGNPKETLRDCYLLILSKERLSGYPEGEDEVEFRWKVSGIEVPFHIHIHYVNLSSPSLEGKKRELARDILETNPEKITNYPIKEGMLVVNE